MGTTTIHEYLEEEWAHVVLILVIVIVIVLVFLSINMMDIWLQDTWYRVIDNYWFQDT